MKISLKRIIRKIIKGDSAKKNARMYFEKFEKYAFIDCKCSSYEQFEASIIRLYHTIEKGLSYSDYRAGFGRENIEKLIITLQQYISKGFDTNAFVYETAISCLKEYIKKNREHGHIDIELEEKISKFPGKDNNKGGTVPVSKPNDTNKLNFEELIRSRHSIRHFSSSPVDLNLLKSAIQLAQNTPSACNRQGWKTRIISDRKKIETILANQNGNRGFGNEFDMLLIITSDLRAQQRGREVFQAFIDGGMYASNVLNALFFKGIGSVPLSASLTPIQEKNLRQTVGINDAEILILIIGIGNYPDEQFLTTRSERKPIDIDVI